MANSSVNQNPKVMYLFLLFSYLAATMLIPIRRVIFENWTGQGVQGDFFQLHPWIAIIFLPFALTLVTKPESLTVRWINKFLVSATYRYLVLTVLVILFLLTIFKVPGWWWTWFTVGLHIATAALVIEGLRFNVTPAIASVAAVGVVSFNIGFWEALYQAYYWKTYDRGIVDVSHLIVTVQFLSPLILGGLGLMAVAGIGKAFPQFNFGFILYAGLFTAGFFTWVTTGMWVDIVYNWSTGIWVYTEDNDAALRLYRGTKVALAMSFILSYSYSKGGSMKQLYGYLWIPVWVGFFCASSAFLLLTWLKSLLSKKEFNPYFKARSIHYDPEHKEQWYLDLLNAEQHHHTHVH